MWIVTAMYDVRLSKLYAINTIIHSVLSCKCKSYINHKAGLRYFVLVQHGHKSHVATATVFVCVCHVPCTLSRSNPIQVLSCNPPATSPHLF